MPENKDEANCKQIYFADRGDFKCFSKEANQQKKSQKRKQQPTKRLTAFRIKAMDSFRPLQGLLSTVIAPGRKAKGNFIFM